MEKKKTAIQVKAMAYEYMSTAGALDSLLYSHVDVIVAGRTVHVIIHDSMSTHMLEPMARELYRVLGGEYGIVMSDTDTVYTVGARTVLVNETVNRNGN